MSFLRHRRAGAGGAGCALRGAAVLALSTPPVRFSELSAGQHAIPGQQLNRTPYSLWFLLNHCSKQNRARLRGQITTRSLVPSVEMAMGTLSAHIELKGCFRAARGIGRRYVPFGPTSLMHAYGIRLRWQSGCVPAVAPPLLPSRGTWHHATTRSSLAMGCRSVRSLRSIAVRVRAVPACAAACLHAHVAPLGAGTSVRLHQVQG